MKAETYIILLRGVTPSGKNNVPMAALRAALTKAGLKDVQTYIQSGNIVVRSTLTQSALENLIHKVIRKKFGGDIVVLARTAQQFARVLKRSPFTDADGSRLYFTFLAKKPDKKLLKELLSTDFTPDRVKHVNNMIYTLYATKHRDSKFNNNFFERKLKVKATTRNLSTMLNLVALTS